MDNIGSLIKFITSKKKALKWFGAGLVFMGLAPLWMYCFVEIYGINVYLATFLAAEINTILRYFVNNFFVFNRSEFSVRGIFNYHIANAGALAIWWIASSVFIFLGVHYLYAGVMAVAFSTLFSFYSNFFWVWKTK